MEIAILMFFQKKRFIQKMYETLFNFLIDSIPQRLSKFSLQIELYVCIIFKSMLQLPQLATPIVGSLRGASVRKT